MAYGDGSGAARHGAGLLDVVKRLLLSCGELVGTRLELLSTEVQEESARLLRVLLLAALAACFLAFAVLMLTLFVVVVFWDTHRLTAIAGAAAFHLLIAGLAALALRRRLNGPRPFSATLTELRKDCERLGPRT